MLAESVSPGISLSQIVGRRDLMFSSLEILALAHISSWFDAGGYTDCRDLFGVTDLS